MADYYVNAPVALNDPSSIITAKPSGNSSASASFGGSSTLNTSNLPAGLTVTASFDNANTVNATTPASLEAAFIPNTPNNPSVATSPTQPAQNTNLFTASNNDYLNNYTVTKKDIIELEKKTNL